MVLRIMALSVQEGDGMKSGAVCDSTDQLRRSTMELISSGLEVWKVRFVVVYLLIRIAEIFY